MSSNPYESPKNASSMPPRFLQQPTRWKAVHAGMWRGARIGFVTVVVVMFGAVLAAGVVAVVGHFFAGWRLPRDLELITWLDVIKSLGMYLLAGLLYGAIPGAVMLGAIAAVRWHPPEITPKPQIS
jgi:hypothetical protein